MAGPSDPKAQTSAASKESATPEVPTPRDKGDKAVKRVPRFRIPLRARRTLWVTLIFIVIVGAVVFFFAGLDTDEDIDPFEEQTRPQIAVAEQGRRRAQALARLADLRAQILAGRNLEVLEQRFAETSDALEAAYLTTEEASPWSEVQSDLSALGAQLRDGTGEATETIDAILARLNLP